MVKFLIGVGSFLTTFISVILVLGTFGFFTKIHTHPFIAWLLILIFAPALYDYILGKVGLK